MRSKRRTFSIILLIWIILCVCLLMATPITGAASPVITYRVHGVCIDWKIAPFSGNGILQKMRYDDIGILHHITTATGTYCDNGADVFHRAQPFDQYRIQTYYVERDQTKIHATSWFYLHRLHMPMVRT